MKFTGLLEDPAERQWQTLSARFPGKPLPWVTTSLLLLDGVYTHMYVFTDCWWLDLHLLSFASLQEITVNASVTSYELQDLFPSSRYQVQVQAMRRGTPTAPTSTSFTTGKKLTGFLDSPPPPRIRAGCEAGGIFVHKGSVSLWN